LDDTYKDISQSLENEFKSKNFKKTVQKDDINDNESEFSFTKSNPSNKRSSLSGYTGSAGRKNKELKKNNSKNSKIIQKILFISLTLFFAIFLIVSDIIILKTFNEHNSNFLFFNFLILIIFLS